MGIRLLIFSVIASVLMVASITGITYTRSTVVVPQVPEKEWQIKVRKVGCDGKPLIWGKLMKRSLKYKTKEINNGD